MLFRVLLISASLATFASLGGDGPTSSSPDTKAQATAQQAADRFLKIRAKLNKSGEIPEYELGEPIVVELEMKNTADDYQFILPSWDYSISLGGSNFPQASQYLVTARRYDNAVPLTGRGEATEEYFKQVPEIYAKRLLIGVGEMVWRFVADPLLPPDTMTGYTNKPFRVKGLVNLLSDMTEPGVYEIEVKFMVQVRAKSLNLEPVTKVVRSGLRLRVLERQFMPGTPPGISPLRSTTPSS